MTALHLDTTPPRDPDVSNPREYKKQVDLALMIARFLVAMPLDEMASMSADQFNHQLLRKYDLDAEKGLKRVRDTVRVLRLAHTELEKIAARYGEA